MFLNELKCYREVSEAMNFPASIHGSFVPVLHCNSCCVIRLQPLVLPRVTARQKYANLRFSRIVFKGNGKVVCRLGEMDCEPDSDNSDEERKLGEEGDWLKSSEPISGNYSDRANSTEEENVEIQSLESNNLEDQNSLEITVEMEAKDNDIQIASGSPLPGVKPQQLDESIRIPKETVDILKDQVFGFDTFFVTSQEPYEGGVLFKGNLRGQAAKSFEKITRRMKDRLGDAYKLFLLINPEDDKPVAVVVPTKTLQPDTTAVPEWFAAGAFGLVAVFTLFLRNVPALQSNLLSTFDNLELLKEGIPGALVTALLLGVHEVSHILVANKNGIKLGLPYFVPSWQIGSFGAITRIQSIVNKREDLLKVAVAGPAAGFTLGFILLLLGFILPPNDGLGIVVDSSVFHESLLVGGIAKLLLGDVLKEGTPMSVNPLVVWSWAGLLINAINSIPAGELDGGRISFAIWGRKASSRLTSLSIALLGLSSLLNDVAFYWAVLIFFLQRGPIAPLSEEITDPDDKYKTLGVVVLLVGLLVCLPYPFPLNSEVLPGF